MKYSIVLYLNVFRRESSALLPFVTSRIIKPLFEQFLMQILKTKVVSHNMRDNKLILLQTQRGSFYSAWQMSRLVHIESFSGPDICRGEF